MKTDTMKQPIIIIGAPRSGTNMLRDALDCFPQVATWNCDEINYIWRHGNLRFPSDEFSPELATDRVQGYIRHQFEKIATRYDVPIVLEKTCANSLRVEYVDQILPEARYLFIRRNGLDVVASAIKRWQASIDPVYLTRKLRYVPVTDIPYHAMRYLWSRTYKLFSREERLAFWGPQLSDMSELLERYSLVEVCGLQWERCVNRAAAALQSMPGGKVMEIGYEEFVSDPTAGMVQIADFVGLPGDDALIHRISEGISTASVGKWRNVLGKGDVRRLKALIGETLDRYDYG